MNRPDKNEYNPYFQHYIDLVESGEFLAVFDRNTEQTGSYFNHIPTDKHDYRYAEGKWTIKEVLMHIMDPDLCFRSVCVANHATPRC